MSKPLVVVVGPVASRSGYGAHARDICTALINSDKYDIRVVVIPWGNTPSNGLPEDSVIRAHIMDGTNLERKPDVFIQITIPSEFQPNGHYNIGITAGIETDKCVSTWLLGCNRMDLILATSEHSRNVFYNTQKIKKDEQTGQTTTIKLDKACDVLFEGIDTAVYNKALPKEEKISKYLDGIKEDFCYLFVGHWLQGVLGQDRKDVGMLIKAFYHNFVDLSPKTRPALILKTSGAGFSEIEKDSILKKIEIIAEGVRTETGKSNLPSIYLLYGDLTDSEINTVYNHKKVKAMVSFTKGEGFGRPLLEFCTTGKPVIASNWSGQIDFLNPQTSILLPGKLENVHPSAVNEWILADSKWFTVDYPIAGATLKDVFKNYDKYHERSKKTAGNVAKNWTFAQMQEKLVDYVDRALTIAETVKLPPTIKLPMLKKLE